MQHVGSGAIKLALHQPRHDVNDGDIHAAQLEAIRGLKSEQPSSNHHRILILACGRNHLFRIVDIAIGQHAVEIFARQRQDERIRSSGQQQAVIVFACAVIGDHFARLAINLHDLLAGVQPNAIFRVPVEIV